MESILFTLSVEELYREIQRHHLPLPKCGSGRKRNLLKRDLVRVPVDFFSPQKGKSKPYSRCQNWELANEINRLGLSMPRGTGKYYSKSRKRRIKRKDLLWKLSYCSPITFKHSRQRTFDINAFRERINVDLAFWKKIVEEKFQITSLSKIGSWRELSRLLLTRDRLESIGKLYLGEVLTQKETESVIRRFQSVLKYQKRFLDRNQFVLSYLEDLLEEEPDYLTSIPYFDFQNLYRSIAEDEYYLYYNPASEKLRIDPFPASNYLRVQYNSIWVKNQFRRIWEEREKIYLGLTIPVKSLSDQDYGQTRIKIASLLKGVCLDAAAYARTKGRKIVSTEDIHQVISNRRLAGEAPFLKSNVGWDDWGETNISRYELRG